MAKVILDQHATAKFKAALEAGRLIQRSWNSGCGKCLLGTLVTEEEMESIWSYYNSMLHRGLSRDVISKITNEFDALRPADIAAYARRFAKVAERPVDYEAAIREAYSAGIPYIDALERQIERETQ